MKLICVLVMAGLAFAGDRPKGNPYEGQADAVKAGAKLYQRYCVSCHEAGDKAPPLTSPGVRAMTPGQLFGVLKDGRIARGMPSWAQLPEEQRWQIITWLKSRE
jgi:mono/diheme cytochrome c family protein